MIRASRSSARGVEFVAALLVLAFGVALLLGAQTGRER